MTVTCKSVGGLCGYDLFHILGGIISQAKENRNLTNRESDIIKNLRRWKPLLEG
jgi:hypothetical protein